MRSFFWASLLLAGAAASPVAAQSVRMKAADCPGVMSGDTCEMSRADYNIYLRNMEQKQALAQEEGRARTQQIIARTRATNIAGRKARSQDIMHQRHAEAAGGGQTN